jgi:hypothetical protein
MESWSHNRWLRDVKLGPQRAGTVTDAVSLVGQARWPCLAETRLANIGPSGASSSGSSRRVSRIKEAGGCYRRFGSAT